MCIRDSFHIHWRNLRLQFSKKEWCDFIAAMMSAWDAWKLLGGPEPHPDRSLPIYLPKVLPVNPEHDINGDNFRIEDDDLNGEAIHVHYRSMRLEYSYKEFLVIADGFTEAAKKLRENNE